MDKMIYTLISAIISMPLIACQFDERKVEINIVKQEGVEYRIHEVPIIVNIKNNGDAPLKLLYPYDIKGKYLGVFNFTCVCRNQKWECQSFVEEKETANLNHPKNFKYIEILPKKDVDIKVMLDKIVAPKLLPGNYTITMVYHNQMDKNCFMGEIKARNRMDITILDEKEDEPKPEYISKDEAKNIAIKGNQYRYDTSQKINVFLKNGIYTVTFPNKLPPGHRGSKIAIQIEIDALTGKILSRTVGE